MALIGWCIIKTELIIFINKHQLRPIKKICVFRVTIHYLIFLVKPNIFFFLTWIKYLCQLLGQVGLSKQCRPRSNCSYRSSLIWSTLFAILSVLLGTSKDSQTVKFYVKHVRSQHIFDNSGINLHKKCKKKKQQQIPTYPTYFFLIIFYLASSSGF